MVPIVAHADDGNLGVFDEADQFLPDVTNACRYRGDGPGEKGVRNREATRVFFVYLHTAPILVARHAVDLIHDQDVFGADFAGRACQSHGQEAS